MSKLNVNELMIGDWVRNDLGEIQRIEEIRQDDVMLSYNDYYSYDEIEPIPLTAEILGKNGFVYNDIPFVQGWEQFGLLLYEGGEGYRINCGTNIALIIDSVHELQHALRLCGIDKTIEL